MSGWENFGAAILGAIIGGIITGFFTLRAVDRAHTRDLQLQQEKEESVISGLLQSIHDEVETLWERYRDGMGAHLESLQDNQPLLMYYPIAQDYFTVYNGNSFLIGKIKDNDLRRLIISTYTQAKGLADSYRMNNDLVGKYEYWISLYSETHNEAHSNNAEAQLSALRSYASSLKKGHEQLKTSVNDLLRSLRKSGVLSEARR